MPGTGAWEGERRRANVNGSNMDAKTPIPGGELKKPYANSFGGMSAALVYQAAYLCARFR